jgi:peptidyl-prolyl cis-trans isomerase SurA
VKLYSRRPFAPARSRPLRPWLAAAGFLLAFALAFPLRSARADEKDTGEVIERIVAIVNAEPLLLSELRTRAAPFLARLMQAPEMQRMTLMQQLYGELLTQLIDERLLEQEARKLSISVLSSDIDRAIENVQRQNNLKDAEFWDAVSAQGFSKDQYKADVRRQLLRLKVINQKVRSRINITEDDVRRKYQETLRAAKRSAQFDVAHVFLPVEADSVAKLSQARAQAETLRKSLTPENFDKAIAEHGGGQLGWVSQSDLPDALSDALLALTPGEISAPVRGPSGIHIFLLKERKLGEESVGDYEQKKADLYREMVDQAMARQEVSYLAELRKQSLITRKL